MPFLAGAVFVAAQVYIIRKEPLAWLISAMVFLLYRASLSR